MRDDPTVYEASRNPYPTWLKYANERDHLEEWLRKNIDRVCPQQDATILDIGSGLGESIARLVKVLKETERKYSITALEPVEVQTEYCRKRFVDNLGVRVEQSTLEEYQGQQVDLVVAVHPLYYVPSLKNALAKLCSLGKKRIIVHHGLRGINTVHQAFPRLVKKGPHIISTYHDIEKELEKLRVDYQTECLESRVDIRTTHNLNNLEGRDLIRFFLEQPEVSESTYQQVSAFLREQGNYLTHEIGIIVA